MDRSELATSASLSDRIQDALLRSNALLLVCSPAAARSRWVDEEVRQFRARGLSERIFCLIVDGDPAAQDECRCFPPSLLARDADGVAAPEPLAADVRPGKDGRRDAALKIIAGLLDLPFDTLRQREQARRQRRMTIVAAVSTVLLLVMTGLAISAVLARRQAERQEQIATRTADFLRSLFVEASPKRTGGREISVREMVDRAAAETIRSPSLRNEPIVRASLLTVLAEVYSQLGLADKARPLLDQADSVAVSDPVVAIARVRESVRLDLITGDNARLRTDLAEQARLIEAEPALARDYYGRMLLDRGQLARSDGDPAAAERDFRAARRWALARVPPERDVAILALLSAAASDIDNGQEVRGVRRLKTVIAERRRNGQPLHPEVLTAFNSLGAAAIRLGDPITAEHHFRPALALQLRLFGDRSLDVALTRNNLGRALVEQRRFAEALTQLDLARAQFLAQTDGRIDTLANLADSRGLALAGLGNAAAAARSFGDGLVIARANAMPKEIDLLTDGAELACRTGNLERGRSLVSDARSALRRFGLTEPWRTARIDNVEGGCLLFQKDIVRAAPLIRRSTPLVIARWGAASLFGTAGTGRLAVVDQAR